MGHVEKNVKMSGISEFASVLSDQNQQMRRNVLKSKVMGKVFTFKLKECLEI